MQNSVRDTENIKSQMGNIFFLFYLKRYIKYKTYLWLKERMTMRIRSEKTESDCRL